MADVYGVTPDDIAEQLPALFPDGFSATTRVTEATVLSFIATADVMAQMLVRQSTGAEGDPSDAAAPIVREWIIQSVLAKVMRAVYAGADPARVAEAMRGYDQNAKDLRAQIEGLGALLTGVDPIQVRVRGDESMGGATERELLLTDDDLGAGARRSKRF
jgi:hypothetical protein